MPTDPLKIAIKGTTQDHLPVEDIIDDVVILKDGSAVSILRVSSVNFDLLSEKEQSALIMAYGGILNSLNFPIQIIIKSETKDITSYMKRLIAAENKQTNQLLKERINKYRKFIEDIVKRNDVLSKSFYVVVKFSSLELGIKSAGKQGLIGLIKKSKDMGLPYPKNYILEKAKASLEPKKDHLIRLFSRLGLEISPLNNKELLDLFYKIYNPEVAENQKIKEVNYYSPMVTTK
jgi:type IV secretory pathway VirB4 component